MKKISHFLQNKIEQQFKLWSLISIFFLLYQDCYSQEIWNYYQKNKSVTYDEAINFYQTIAAKDDRCKMLNYGKTDCGRPLELFIINEQ